MSFRGSEPLLDELDLLARCRDALLRLLLERVQHVNRVVETDCIDRAVGVTFMRRHDLKKSAPSETLSRMGTLRQTAPQRELDLCGAERAGERS